MATYRGKAPISKKDLRRAKLEAKRARAAKMASGASARSKARYGGRFNVKLAAIIGSAVLALGIVGMLFFITTQKQPTEQDLLDVVANGTYGSGITVAGVNIGGQTMSEAKVSLASALNAKLDSATISFDFNDETHTRTAMDLGLITDVEAVLNQAMMFEKTGTKREQKKNMQVLTEQGMAYSVNILVDEAALNAAAADMKTDFVVAPTEPQMSFNPDATTEAETISWSDEIPGFELDTAAFVAAVKTAVQTGNYSLGTIATTALLPNNTVDSISGSIVKLSEYTTYFGYGSYDEDNRVFNIAKMAELLTGQTVQPGEDWSVNDTTGARSEDNGWKEANAIRKGVLIKELGGGVCQVSGTLYNAFLLADLGIVERHAHTYPSDYINKVGRYQLDTGGYEFDYVTRRYDLYHIACDATIDYGNKDLIIRNTLGENIYIVVEVDDEAETVTASVYAPPRNDDYQVVIRTLLHEELTASSGPEIRIAEDGIGPNGSIIPIGQPLAWPAPQDGAEYWTYKYYYPAGYDFTDDPDPYSWIGYEGSDFPNSGEKYRIQFEGSDTYIDSLYPPQAGVYYYNPADPATQGMPGSTYVPPANGPGDGGDGGDGGEAVTP